MSKELTSEQQAIYVSIWSKAIETQMHFNEMSVKSRQFGLAFVAAALGLGIVLISRNEDFSIPIPFPFGGFDLNMTVIIAFAGAAALYAVKLLDLNVYHKMLRGAVTFNEDFERNYMRDIFALEKGMTEAISHFSRFEDASIELAANGTKYHYKGDVRKNALTKINLFYRFSIGTLIAVGVALFVATAHFGKPQGGVRQLSTKEPTVRKTMEKHDPVTANHPAPVQIQPQRAASPAPQPKEPSSGQ